MQCIDKALINENPELCIVIEDLNINYQHPKNHITAEIADAIKSHELNNLGTKFKI